MKQLITLITIFIVTTTFSQDNIDLKLIKEYLIASGIAREDIKDLKIQSYSYSKSLEATTVYIIQQFEGIPIKKALGVFVLKNGEVVSFNGNFIDNISSKINTLKPSLTPQIAVEKAALALKLGAVEDITLLNQSKNRISFKLSKGNISQDDIPVSMVYEISDNELLLSWDLNIHTLDGENWYSVRIDANSGVILSKNNWVQHCNFEKHSFKKNRAKRSNSVLTNKRRSSNLFMSPVYNVFPIPIESPNHGDRQLISNPENIEASPFGWHDINGIVGTDTTDTTGNNVFAAEDVNGNDGIGITASGGEGLIFDFPIDFKEAAKSFRDAAITNLFYVNNVAHDVWYQYGFDESSGNFQLNNYGKGGVEDDAVLADAHDGSGSNNAFMTVPPDGTNPRMDMFLWNLEEVRLTINNGTLAGDYNVIDNDFTTNKDLTPPIIPNAITGNLVLVIDDTPDPDPNDTCSNIINESEINGNIAVVRRGQCEFTEKVFACELAGARAVIIVNNIPGNITMTGENSSINIPAVSINQEEGEAIISAMSSNVLQASLGSISRQDAKVGADGSFDNAVILHEYGHGISRRLSGGASTSDCLEGDEQMGEGWSDWFGLIMTIKPGDVGTDSRGIATYLLEEPVTGKGLRPYPYSTDMSVNPVTYGSISDQSTFSVPHGVGSVWAAILWDMAWAFIDRDGYDSDLYNGTGGNNLAMQLVIDGLKLQTCSPGFVDGRNAIILADQIANGGVNACLIWEVFARRGLGWSAVQGSSSSRSDQVEAFDMPPTSQLNCVLHVEDIDSGGLRVYPNPSTGIFDITAPSGLNINTISIYDLNGRIVYVKNIEADTLHNKVNVDLESGVYILKIEEVNSKKITTLKVIID